jgi:DNA polymerase-3 subunit delta'
MPFNSIHGHAAPLRMLKNILVSDKIPHALLFSGIEGIGKKKAAVSFAKALNCLEAEDDFCDSCLSCSKIDRMIHPDVQQIEPDEKPADDKKKEGQTDRIRRLQREIAYKPLEGKKKVVIINDAEKLNSNSVNCFLKTLEEPGDDTIIILISKNVESMLSTVVSRCQKVSFRPLGDAEISGLLEDRGIDKEAAARVLSHAQGSVKRALFLLESDFLSKRTEVGRHLSLLSKSNFETAYDLSKLINDDPGREVLFEFLQTWYRDVLFIMEGLSDSVIYNRDLLEGISVMAENETKEGVMKKMKRLQWFNNNPSLTVNFEMGLQSLFTQGI